jgi:hypothetical protein
MFVKFRIQICSGEFPYGVNDSMQHGGVRCDEKEVAQVHTHTTGIYTQTLSDTQVPLQALTQHKHNLPTITNHHTIQVLNTMSQLYDGIQCRLTARTAESAKGEILD